MIYDIRGNNEEEVAEIKFDEWNDHLVKDQHCLRLNSISISHWEDFDNFIITCYKAKELWGPK